MDQQSLRHNIKILEHLGWFIAEDEADEDANQFDAILNCCQPDGTSIERVPATGFLISLYEEEDGSLEARLWFFAPKYATSLDNLSTLITEDSAPIEWSIFREYYSDIWRYEANITSLKLDAYDGELYEESSYSGTSHLSASLALLEAYLRYKGAWDESDHSG